jgi:hypothetical protein
MIMMGEELRKLFNASSNLQSFGRVSEFCSLQLLYFVLEAMKDILQEGPLSKNGSCFLVKFHYSAFCSVASSLNCG